MIDGLINIMISGFAECYGLDWVTMVFGVPGGYLMAKKDQRGIVCNIIACSSSFALALISHQYGFLISNLLTLVIMTRAWYEWGKEGTQETKA